MRQDKGLKELLSDLKRGNELVNRVLAALANGTVGNDLYEQISSELSDQKIGAILHRLIWSDLSIVELVRYLGAFRFDVSKAKLQLSELIFNQNDDKAATIYKWEEIRKRMEVTDQIFADHISFISCGFISFDAFVKNEGNTHDKPIGDYATIVRKLEKEKSEQKIATALSVKQLGFWIRLQKEHGILDGENIALIVRQFAQYYSSKRTGNVSEQSLYNEYFDTTQVDAAVVRAALKSMLQYIDKEFFS